MYHPTLKYFLEGLLASGGWDLLVRLWDVASGDSRGILEGNTFFVNDVAFSPDGTLIATAGADRTIRIWDLRTKQIMTVLSGHIDELTHVLFSPDGKLLISSSRDGTVRVWGK